MQRMSESEWQEVVDIVGGLWPNHAAKMTAEQLPIWRDVLGRYPKAWVVSVLRGAYERSKFFPKLPELRAELGETARRTSTGDGHGRIREESEQRDRLAEEWREVEAAIEPLSDDEILGHVVRIVAANPHLVGIAKPKSLRSSRGVQAQVVSRIQRNLGPFEDRGVRWEPGRFDENNNWRPGGNTAEVVPLAQRDIERAEAAIRAARGSAAGMFEQAIGGAA